MEMLPQHKGGENCKIFLLKNMSDNCISYLPFPVDLYGVVQMKISFSRKKKITFLE